MPLELTTPPEVQQFPVLDSNESAGELLRIQDQLTDDRFWSILRWVWIRHGGSVARLNAQHTLLMADRSSKSFLMTFNEQVALGALADELVVYHGTSTQSDQFGWSWSLDLEISRGFARSRFSDGPRVIVGRCRKQNVIAYFPGYDEDEVVIDPIHVTVEAELVRDDLYNYRP